MSKMDMCGPRIPIGDRGIRIRQAVTGWNFYHKMEFTS